MERAVARIDTGAIERNCMLLARRAPLCAVVKADGYGHGAATAARAALAGGAAWLATATAAEAAGLREEGIEARILVMGALTREETELALRCDADVVAWDREWVGALPGPARVHVKLDTGMGRLGTKDPEEASAIAGIVAEAEGLELAGAMTHFATADELGDEHFPAQLERFRVWAEPLKDRHPAVILHAANSAATLRADEALFDMVRCGVAIYGLDPFQRDPGERELEPALSLHSWLASVKRFEAGEPVGYGRRFTAAESTWIGVVPIGYGDGWRRALSGNAEVLVRGERRPLVGTVSMDNVTIDLGPEAGARPGEEVVLIGAQGGERILAESIAARLATINYEVTCALTPRVRREPV